MESSMLLTLENTIVCWTGLLRNVSSTISFRNKSNLEQKSLKHVQLVLRLNVSTNFHQRLPGLWWF